MGAEYVTADHTILCVSGIPRRPGGPLERAQRRHRPTLLLARRGPDADAQDGYSASHCLQLDHRSVTSSCKHPQTTMSCHDNAFSPFAAVSLLGVAGLAETFPLSRSVAHSSLISRLSGPS